jgi:D-alanyl-D-alanine carboxypeptidase (penicillin-binding protein 5/6)
LVRGLPAPPQIRGATAILIDVQTGAPLAVLDANQRMYPASLTKIMTAILAAERLQPDQIITVSPEAAAVGETSLGLKPGQQISVRDLLTGALMKSANDAATALAVQMAGSAAQFAVLMNARAREMGLRGTHFVNPHGLHNANHYTTAADLAIMGRWFLSYPLLRQICGQPYADLPDLTPGTPVRLWNQNRLLRRWNECIGMKTGYTRQAGNCIVAAARHNGWELLCVVLNSRDTWTDSRSLLEWGYANFRQVAPAGGLREACQVPVRGGAREFLPAFPAPVGGLVLPRGVADWQVEVHPQIALAPVVAGQKVGYAVVTVAGKPAQRVPLLAAEACPVKSALRLPSTNGMWGLLLGLGAVVLYGAAAKNLSARRRRLPALVRETDRGRSRNRGRRGRDGAGAEGGPGAQPGARGWADPAPLRGAPVRPPEQARRLPHRKAR